MIVQIFIAQCQPVDPLRHHLPHAVPYPALLTAVQKAIAQPSQQINAPIYFAQQQPAAIRTNPSSIETRPHRTGPQTGKLEIPLGTLCSKHMGGFLLRKLLCGNSVMPEVTVLCHLFVRYPG